MGEMDSITSPGTRTTRTFSGTTASTPSDRITVSSRAYFAASSSSLVPSDTYSPAASRSFREARSFFTCCSNGFFREVILSVITASAPPPGPYYRPALP